MAKREFVQLAHTFDSDKHSVAGWYWSHKLDGQRALWDGGITRGLSVYDVPWANTTKDARFIDPDFKSTGLWSRNGKVIHAPAAWLDNLPKMILDGELYAGIGNYQLTSSVVRSVVSDRDWNRIKFMVLDRPSVSQLFSDGVIDTIFYKKTLHRIDDWLRTYVTKIGITVSTIDPSFIYVYNDLLRANIENDVLNIVRQERLPHSTQEALWFVESKLNEYVAAGGEGLILRQPMSIWTPERSHNVLKVKKWHDSEATVIGYAWGRKTNKGSKLLGKMGALVVQWNGLRFELSGFTDAEREMCWIASGNSAADAGRLSAGKPVENNGLIHNPKFPIGSKVTFRYRELTDRGCPKEARYFRK